MRTIKVRYCKHHDSKEAEGREYTYFSEDDLKVGDLVGVPIREHIGKAQVSAIDIPDTEIEAFRDKVKIIPAGSQWKEKETDEAQVIIA